MSFTDFFLLLAVAGICGSIGQAISGYTRSGCITSIAIGFIGAVLGVWIARELSLPEFFMLKFGEQSFPVIWSILGSALFISVIGKIGLKKKKR
ncbi:MAG TPA: hypothetical protein ENJ29_16130 [Bacteroidetes bacterium]|nr:hypothetical protein [Bacteroidota bacterium]